MKTEAAITDYAKILKKQQVLKDAYVVESTKLEHIKHKIETYLVDLAEPVKEVPEIIKEQSPYFAWKWSIKTDETLISAHMQIDDVLLVEMQKEVDAKIKALKEQKEAIESYALAVMTERGCSNFGVTGIGRVENRTNTRYTVNDKKLFVADALKNGYADEITVTVRPNSKLLAQIVEERSELPPGVSSHKESKAVFVKG